MTSTITVERVGHALLVGTREADTEAAALAAALAPERHRTAVVVGKSAVEAVSRLDPWVIADLDDQVSGNVRLLTPRLGAAGPAGQVPPARLLADRLGVEVVAPDNDLLSLPGGAFFVAGANAGWVSYRPGSTGRRTGPRHPAPWWQHHLPRAFAAGVGEIPLGLWIREPGGPDLSADPLHGVAPDPQRLTVVVGAPGEPTPRASAVAAVLRALPGDTRDRTVLAAYGDHDIAQAVADVLGAPVRSLHTAPVKPIWFPFAVESVHLPNRKPVLERWKSPAPSLTMVAPAVHRLVGDWYVEVVPRGLVVCGGGTPVDPTWSAPTGHHADVLLVADGTVPEEVVAALGALARELPEDAREHLRVLPSSPFAATAARRVPEFSGRVADTGQLRDERRRTVVITADGRLLPAEPLIAPPTTTLAGPVASPALRRGAPQPARAAMTGVFRSQSVRETPEATPAPLPALPLPSPAPVADPPAAAATNDEQTARSTALTSTTPETCSATRNEPERTGPVAPPHPEARTSPVPADAHPIGTLTTTSLVVPSSRPAAAEARPPHSSPAGPPSTAGGVPDSPAPTTTAPDTGIEAETTTPESASPQRTTRRRGIPVVPANATSTAEQRAGLRGALGDSYDVATRAVSRLLAERPGLRGTAHDAAALLPELAAVRVFADNHDDDYDEDFHVCLTAGLRRLPTLRGVVVRGAAALPSHEPGAVLTLTAPVLAVSALAPRPATDVEVLIWTTTARRLDGLLDGDSADVVIPAHARLRVLAVQDGDRPRVLLAEEGVPADQAMTRLTAAAVVRAAQEPTGPACWSGDLPATETRS